jgi:transposase
VSETALGPAALAMLAVMVPFLDFSADDPAPVLADKAYDSDWLREHLASRGFLLITPHKSNRVSPAMIDGRRLRRYTRRYKVERTFAWLHSFRRVVTRYEKRCRNFEGFVQLACGFIALGKLIEGLPDRL